MIRSKFQFKIGFLLLLTIVAAIAVAFCTNPSLFTFNALVFGCCAFLLGNFPCYRKQPVLIGAVIGGVGASVLMLAVVLIIAIDPPVYQGQLYHEDGPEVYYIFMCMLWLFATVVASLLGMLAGVVIDMLIEFGLADQN